MLAMNGFCVLGALLVLPRMGCTVSLLSTDPIYVFDYCVQLEGISPVQAEIDPMLETMLTIVQDESSKDKVLTCVTLNLDKLRNSADIGKQFAGKVLNVELVENVLTQATSIYQQNKDYACLKAALSSARNCYDHAIRKVYYSGEDNVDRKGPELCNLSECMNLKTLSHYRCREDEEWLLQAVGVMMFGTCFDGRKGIKPVTTSPGAPSERPDSVFFKCGDKLFPNKDIALVFPPSDITELPMDVKAAAKEHKEMLKQFCGNVEQFSNCFIKGLIDPVGPTDAMLSELFDVQNDTSHGAFGFYCSKQELVTSNFMCTVDKLKTDSKCGGGVVDIVYKVSSLIHNFDIFGTEQLCDVMNTAMACQIDDELRPCNNAYGDHMMVTYLLLKSDTCRTRWVPPKTNGKVIRCFREFMWEFQVAFKRAKAMKEVKIAVINYLRMMCSKRTGVLGCLKNVYKEGMLENEYDRLIFDLYTPDNIIDFADYACGMVEGFVKHYECVMETNFVAMVKTNDSCLIDTARPIIDLVKNASVEDRVPKLCETIRNIQACGAQLFDGCGDTLPNQYKTIGSMISRSCNSTQSSKASGTSCRPFFAFIFSVLLHCIYKQFQK